MTNILINADGVSFEMVTATYKVEGISMTGLRGSLGDKSETTITEVRMGLSLLGKWQVISCRGNFYDASEGQTHLLKNQPIGLTTSLMEMLADIMSVMLDRDNQEGKNQQDD